MLCIVMYCLANKDGICHINELLKRGLILIISPFYSIHYINLQITQITDESSRIDGRLLVKDYMLITAYILHVLNTCK